MMLNKKGQALVEFVLILPIILILILGMVDISRIIIRKSELENILSDQINVWKKEELTISDLKETLSDKNTNVSILENETTSFITVEVKEKITFLTPIVGNILNDYSIKVKRVVPYE